MVNSRKLLAKELEHPETRAKLYAVVGQTNCTRYVAGVARKVTSMLRGEKLYTQEIKSAVRRSTTPTIEKALLIERVTEGRVPAKGWRR